MLAIIIILAVFIAVAMIPLSVRGRYAPGEVLLQIRSGLLKITLLPKNEDKPQKPPKQEKEKKEEPAADTHPKQSLDIPELLKAGLPALFDTLGRLRRKLTVNELTLWFSSGSPDPYDAAMNYGKVSAVLGALVPVLDRYFNIRKRDIRTAVSFEGEGNSVLFDITLTLRLWQIIYIVFGMWPVVKVLLRKPENRKVEEHG